MVFNRIKYVSFAVLAPLLMLNCFTSEKALPGVYGEGQIVGKVVGTDGMAIQGVTVTTTYQGVTYTKTSSNKGNFTFKIDNVKRGEGFQVHLAKTEFQSTDYATVITLPNLKVDMGNLVMYIEGDEGSGITRQITGQILDNFSFKPLIGANVAVTDSAGQVRTGVTGEDGKFTIQSNYFKGPARDADGNLLPPPYPSYQLSAFKSNYITRTDLIAKMSSDDVPIEDGQIKLYNKFGSVYGYVVEDTITPETPLNGVEAKIVNSNNQTHICPTGGPYNPEPLSETDFCPDMDDDFGTANYGANGGGFKIKSQFIFLGNRYNIELSKTSAACQARTTGATGCYRSKTLFSDIYLTGNNAITGEKTNLLWDSWIEGTVTGGAGAGVVVKLYDVNNTYLTQTTSTAGGKFIFDNPQILRAKVYKMTFEKDGYYARLLGVPDGTRPCGGGTMYQSEVPITITANGSNDVGSVPMTAACPPNECVRGTVTDYWTTLPVDGAQVRIFDSSGAWQTTTTNSFGEFIINGTFAHPPDRIGSRAFASDVVTGLSISTADLRVGMLVKGTSLPVGTKIIQILSANSVRLSDQSTATVADNLQFMRLNDVEITKSGYTGATEVSKQIFQFGHDGSATCPATPYNLDTNINACGVTDVGPVGAKNCTGNLVLYPIGIFAPMGNFKHQIKQTYEKFLTEKAGLTISARTGSLVLTSGAQRNLNFDGFYLHFDDTPKALPNVPEGKWSNHVPVNAMSTKCTPTVTTNCSPRANGVFAEGIGDDTRATPWGLKTYVYYNFYAAAAGSYTIQTTGGTDTQITLYAQTGANMGSDDDSGSGSNAKMTLNLLRGWYYIKVFPKNNNTFGFFDVEVTGPTQDESNYSAMLTPTTPSSVDYQTVNGTASYQTNCAPGNGNLVLSWYNHTDHLLYIAAPGENGGCNAKAWLEKHDAIGGIIRGRFEGVLRPIAPGGSNQTIPPNTGPGIGGFFNIVRME